jgi:predicted alpha/beta hydrolase family esterase
MANVASWSEPVEPLVLLVPGLGGSGPGHWQTRWERQRADCRLVDLGLWNRPHRNTWVNKLNHAISDASRPVVLVAHSLGCLAVSWWAALERPTANGVPNPVIGALLVAPPEVDFYPLDDRLKAFAPAPEQVLPFPSILVASHDDPYMSFRRARHLAGVWGSGFADAGRVGHINAASELGDWPFGQFLLRRLLSGKQMPLKPGTAEAGEASGLAHVQDASPATLRLR